MGETIHLAPVYVDLRGTFICGGGLRVERLFFPDLYLLFPTSTGSTTSPTGRTEDMVKVEENRRCRGGVPSDLE